MATGKQKSIEPLQEAKRKIRDDGDSEEFGTSLSLPRDIITYDILTRVPIDSLMRFRCVRKSWSNLIVSDSKFMDLHSSRTYSDRGFIWLFYSDSETDFSCVRSNGIVFYDIDKKENKVFRFRPETGLVNKTLNIRDSLNGLVLLSCHEDHQLVTLHVYNPITGISSQLPALQGIHRLQLAYDSIMGKYKVLCLCLTGSLKEHIFKIVTLGGSQNESWRDVVVSESFPRLQDNYRATFSGESLYWLTHDRSGSCSDQRKILGFNASKETFYTIKYPKGALNDAKLVEIDGLICFLNYVSSTAKLKLWALKKKKNQHQEYEWVEKYNVDDMPNMNGLRPPNIGYKSDCCYAILTNPTVKIIFWTYNRGLHEAHREGYGGGYDYYEFRSYDIQLKKLESIFKMRKISYQWHLNCLAHF